MIGLDLDASNCRAVRRGVAAIDEALDKLKESDV
jgi:hypothetical protein